MHSGVAHELADHCTPFADDALVRFAPQIPYFNAPIFLQNKTQIGKVEEILGPINSVVGGTSLQRTP